MFTFYHSCCISPDCAPMIYCIYYCRLRTEKYMYGLLCIWANHICHFGEFASFYKTARNQEHFVEESWMSRIRNFIMWIKELWLLVLVENKESRKNWEYHDKKKKNQRGLCQVKRRKGCERYRKWNRPWPILHVSSSHSIFSLMAKALYQCHFFSLEYPHSFTSLGPRHLSDLSKNHFHNAACRDFDTAQVSVLRGHMAFCAFPSWHMSQ